MPDVNDRSFDILHLKANCLFDAKARSRQ